MTEKKTLEQIYNEYPFKGQKFKDKAKEYGFSNKQVNDFLKSKVIRDRKPEKAQYIPIVSKSPGSYQMDTFINQKAAKGFNYLMLININTRKAYAYTMRGKGAHQVKAALENFIKEEPNVKSIMSDQDASYLSNEVLDWMKSHNIHYTTTKDDNHNNLGIINRFMRTIRDMAVNRGLMDANLWEYLDENGDFEDDYKPSKYIHPVQMKELISGYNNTKHRTTGKIPNKMTNEEELKYIQEKKTEKNPYDFKEGDKVQIIESKDPFTKKRRKVSHSAYTIDSREGNQFNIVSKDKSVNAYPGYKLIKSEGYVPLASTLKDGKRGIVKQINEYYPKTDSYNITWDDNSKSTIHSKNLREGQPTTLSRMERIFWLNPKNKDKIPPKIRRFI